MIGDRRTVINNLSCYGNNITNGWSAGNKNNHLTDEWFERRFPDNPLIGGIEDLSRKLTLTSPVALKEFCLLPAIRIGLILPILI